MTSDEITKLASRFTEQLPDKTFSPAEIQGYLLTKKIDARSAIDELVCWRDDAVKAKRLGTKAESHRTYFSSLTSWTQTKISYLSREIYMVVDATQKMTQMLQISR